MTAQENGVMPTEDATATNLNPEPVKKPKAKASKPNASEEKKDTTTDKKKPTAKREAPSKDIAAASAGKRAKTSAAPGDKEKEATTKEQATDTDTAMPSDSNPKKKKGSGSRKPKREKAPDAAATPDAELPDDDAAEFSRLRVELSASLKRELLTGWERITREGKLLQLPKEKDVTVAEVLKKYKDDAVAKAKNQEQESLAVECAEGLQAYFDAALRSNLLYTEEREQADAVLKSSTPSAVYGAEHLLRLFVKLPELLPVADMDANAAKVVQVKLTEVLRWMQRNAALHFGGEYVEVGGKEEEQGVPVDSAVEVPV